MTEAKRAVVRALLLPCFENEKHKQIGLKASENKANSPDRHVVACLEAFEGLGSCNQFLHAALGGEPLFQHGLRVAVNVLHDEVSCGLHRLEELLEQRVVHSRSLCHCLNLALQHLDLVVLLGGLARPSTTELDNLPKFKTKNQKQRINKTRKVLGGAN